MNALQRIEDLIAEPLLNKGFEIVRIQLQGSQKKTLQIIIERQDEKMISTEDCVVVNDLVSVLLDVEDPIQESYTLEISSPGLDRPLTRKKDFKRFAGSLIKIELKTPYQGARRLQGILEGIEGDSIKLNLGVSAKNENVESVEFAFSDVQKAKLVPNYDA